MYLKLLDELCKFNNEQCRFLTDASEQKKNKGQELPTDSWLREKVKIWPRAYKKYADNLILLVSKISSDNTLSFIISVLLL